MIRVVAGAARGRRLVAPPGRDVRPTGDRVKEAMFNALVSLDAVEGAVVLDLFAGSGALAIEALSRGAATATLVDQDRAARAAVAENLAATGFADRATVVPGDAFVHLGGGGAHAYELVLCDPPYGFGRWPDLLALLPTAMAVGGVLVVESDQSVEMGEPFDVLREKRYGGTVVTIARARTGPPASFGEPS